MTCIHRQPGSYCLSVSENETESRDIRNTYNGLISILLLDSGGTEELSRRIKNSNGIIQELLS